MRWRSAVGLQLELKSQKRQGKIEQPHTLESTA
jgi:hypothetical protein